LCRPPSKLKNRNTFKWPNIYILYCNVNWINTLISCLTRIPRVHIIIHYQLCLNFLIIVGNSSSHQNHFITSVAIGDNSGSTLWQFCYSSNKTWTKKWFIIFYRYKQCDEISYYDEQFRLRKAQNPSSSWSEVDAELWLFYMQGNSSTNELTMTNNMSLNRNNLKC
jgi:hypothetical protein